MTAAVLGDGSVRNSPFGAKTPSEGVATWMKLNPGVVSKIWVHIEVLGKSGDRWATLAPPPLQIAPVAASDYNRIFGKPGGLEL